MSVWRIQKVDAQTRVLAEAAAKAAGLPLGVWLERAILRRVEGRTPPTQPFSPIPTDVAAAPAEDEAEISSEMQAALEAAERRRRERAGEDGEAAKAQPYWGAASAPTISEVELADPFATPEKISEESPFEQPPATEADAPIALALTLADDEAILLAKDPELSPREAPDAKDVLASLEDPDPLPTTAIAADAQLDDPSGAPEPSAKYVPSWEKTQPSNVTTTARESLALPIDGTRRRAPSSLALMLGGLFVILAAAGGAYVFLIDAEQLPSAVSTASTTSPSEPEKPVAQAPAQPTAPPAAAPTAPASITAPPDPTPTPPTGMGPTADSAAPAPAPALPQTGGPSIVNLAAGDPSQPPLPTPATAPVATAPPGAVPAAEQPAVANEALPSLRARAEAGNMEAQLELGRRYIQGMGVGRNDVEASKWLLRAAEQGNAQAQFNVGVMYERGVGLETNLTKAIDFYRKSAAQNTPMALHNLGLLYVSGQPGIKADPTQARRLMTQAAELGQIESQYSLALMHLQGVGGPIDKIAAMSWMAIAARPNQPQLIEAAKQLSAQLNPAERQRAQQLAETTVRRVQANLQKLQATGTGPQAAVATPASATPATPRVIDRTAITEMQKLLASLKIYNGAADGAMGPRTAAAIREFQSMAGMPVDGKPSVELLENLRDVSSLTKQ